MVGIYSNYLLIVQAITSILGSALTGILATIGNLNTTKDKAHKEQVFYDIFFISVWIYGFCSIALLTLLNPFIKIWVGEQYLLPISAVIAIVLHFYICGIQFAGYTYRVTMGLFIKGKKAPIYAAIINIVLSITLAYKMGLTGILLATSVARLLTTTWYDPYIVHKNEFGTSPIKFFKKYLFYFLIVGVVSACCYLAVYFIGDGIISFIIKGGITLIVSNLLFYILFKNKSEFKNNLNRIKGILNRRKGE